MTQTSPFTPPVWALAAATLMLATCIVGRTSAIDPQQSGKGPAAPTSSEDARLAARGQEITEKACIICHTWENITRSRRTQKEWAETVVSMVQRGAPGSEAEFAVVKKFLTRYHGVVDVNSAAADELSAVLGLSARDANAIVAHRKIHGKFADAAALARVEGIDRAKLTDPDTIRFD